MAHTDLAVADGLVIPAAELKEYASRSSGPGGQHVNKTSTRVTLRWNIRRSEVLASRIRSRLLSKLSSRLTRAGVLIVHAEEFRSRTRNREAARTRLAEIVAEASAIQRPRRPTQPTRGSQERRLGDKKRRSGLKKLRRADEESSD